MVKEYKKIFDLIKQCVSCIEITKEDIKDTIKIFHMVKQSENETSTTANYYDYENLGVWFSLDEMVELIQNYFLNKNQSLATPKISEVVEQRDLLDVIYGKCSNCGTEVRDDNTVNREHEHERADLEHDAGEDGYGHGEDGRSRDAEPEFLPHDLAVVHRREAQHPESAAFETDQRVYEPAG